MRHRRYRRLRRSNPELAAYLESNDRKLTILEKEMKQISEDFHTIIREITW